MTATIALLGTSADPPTLGHQALLEGLLNHFQRVATWASDNPMKRHDACLELRSELLQTLVKAIDNPRVDINQTLSSPYTITTLERASRLWPHHDLCFVVGSDLAAQIPHWKHSDLWLKRCRLGVVPRKGWPLQHDHLERLRHLGARITVLPLQIPETASSSIRETSTADQIPKPLWPLVLQHNLYGLQDAPS
ncbi:nicotinate-nucleotide adenylyltransferase [Synechococcus sp. WH 8020]|uniref:nicotinate-nucleotide adenylyltransferase n=1 Tax=unclassified Synechococcus TaxID=2626047 RepID=UPI00065276BF|nr:nicotinate-nucleotide adenylyltransferase [Synechococcus sp. WH 8020]AKN61115.1 nicotinate-nucleotide adenylyltransferase [Synechococcus sp. WH 8020]